MRFRPISLLVLMTAIIGLLYYGTRSKVAFSVASGPSQSPAPELFICGRNWGRVDAKLGSGACAGNVHIAVSLSELYPGLILHYNSTGNYNPSGLGKNWTLSEVTFVAAGESPSLQLGDGNIVRLKYNTSGKWNGRILAKDRSIINDLFSVYSQNPNILWQQSMNGQAYRYTIVGPNYFRLDQAISRFNEITHVQIGEDLSSERIAYADGEIVNLSRSSGTLLFSNGDTTVTARKDQLNRITEIRSSEGPTHYFEYLDSTPRVAKHKWQSSSASPLLENAYRYDDRGKLISFVDQNRNETRFVRIFTGGIVETHIWNGQKLVETFAGGKITSSKVFVAGYNSPPISEVKFEYNGNGTLWKKIMPQQTVEYIWNPLDPGILVWENISENDQLVRKVGYTTDKDTYLAKRRTVTRGDGSVISDADMTYKAGAPYLPTRIRDLVSGKYQTFTYSGNSTTVKHFNQNATLILQETFDKRNLVSRTNPLAPAASRTQTWSYVNDQLDSSTLRNQVTDFGSDAQGRTNFIKYPNGTEISTLYNGDHDVQEETTKYPTGISEKTTYSRTFYPDGSIAVLTATKEVKNASGQLANQLATTREVYFSDKVSGHKVMSTKLNGVENFRR